MKSFLIALLVKYHLTGDVTLEEPIKNELSYLDQEDIVEAVVTKEIDGIKIPEDIMPLFKRAAVGIM